MWPVAGDGLLDLDAAARFIGEPPKELERLVRIGAIVRQSGRFNPVALVRGYIEHIRDAARRENESPTQIAVAEHLDMSERNARDVLNRLGIDPKQSSLEAIRIAYIRYMRELAAGRGGDEQASLTRARTKQALADSAIKELQYHREMAALVPVEDIEPTLRNWAAMARSEVQYAVEKLVSGIQSRHGIEVDQKLIDDTFTPAFRSVGSYPSQLAQDDGAGGEGVDSPAASVDAAMAG